MADNISKNKICFIAQFPPPIHGLSKAVDTLYNSELNKKFEFEKIDITNNKKFLRNLINVYKSKADLFYFTISQTKGGNLRDLLFFKAIGTRPCLIHLHGGYYRTLVDKDLSKWQRKANYSAIAKLSAAIVLGPSLKWIFEGMLPEEKIFTVPNCVDNEYLMSNKEFESKISTIDDRKIKHVLYLSNFIKTKGYTEVLRMAKLEKDRVDSGENRALHFDFAGKFFDNDDERKFSEYIRSNNLSEYITYHGVVSGEKKRELLRISDIFVLLTTYPNEGQPISILEAMGNGMVIVSTNHAGIPDQVTDGVNGIVVDKDNINSEMLFKRIISIDNYIKYEIANRSTIINLFSQNSYIKNMKNCFDQIGGNK